MIKALFLKEWLKMRYALFAAGFALAAIAGFFYANTAGEFAYIEPKTMLWYRAIFIGIDITNGFIYIPAVLAVAIALVQFLPESAQKKFRISLHLPINQNVTLLLYMATGLSFLLLGSGVFGALSFGVIWHFYPQEIALEALKVLAFYTLAAFGVYGSVAATIIEPLRKQKFFYLVLTGLFVYVAFFELWHAQGLAWLFTGALAASLNGLMFLAVFHYKRGNYALFKTKENVAKVFFIAANAAFLLLISIALPQIYAKIFADPTKTVRILFSPLIKSFVYEAHYGHHIFVWGSSSGQKFSQKEYEALLPFNFYRDLEIQGKLPVTIDGKTFDVQEIKKGRQSFSVSPAVIEKSKTQIGLYPLFNTDNSKGSIAFPDYFFKITDRFIVLNGDTNAEETALSKEYGAVLKQSGFGFKARLIAGKTTNLKPFDEGYFLQDLGGNFFHMKVTDGKMSVKKTGWAPQDVLHIGVFENNLREFYGILINSGGLNLISYDNYKLIHVDLTHYEPLRSKLEFFKDPLYNLFRYEDGDFAYADVFDKNYTKIASYKMAIPKAQNIFTQNFQLFFPFFTDAKSLKIQINQPEFLIFNAALAILLLFYFLATFKKISGAKLLAVLFFGIYGLVLDLLA